METIKTFNSEQLYANFTEADCNKALPNKEDYSYETARNRAYLNRLCQQILVPILEEDAQEKAQLLSAENSSQIWEFINGFAVNFTNLKLVIIPSENLDIEEFSIPAEWVEISQFVADYYLAVQVNVEEKWLRVWGFTSYQNLRIKGEFDESDRSYNIDAEDLYSDLNLIWLNYETENIINQPDSYNIKTHRQDACVTNQLDLLHKNQLIKKLSQPSNYSPRLTINSDDWKIIFGDEKTRKQIYQNRCFKIVNNISHWQRNTEENNWLFTDTLVNQYHISEVSLARMNKSERESTPEKLVLSRGKIIDLGIQIEGSFVALICKCEYDTETSRSILLKVCPGNNEKYLPPNIELIVYDEKDEVFLEAKSRQSDNWIQLQFQGEIGEEFSVKVALGEAFIKEYFRL